MNVLHLAGRLKGGGGEMVVDEDIFKGQRDSLSDATFDRHIGQAKFVRLLDLSGAWNYFVPLEWSGPTQRRLRWPR
jgi:hypothetical protein